MAVTVEDIRIHLNGITSDELLDGTIEQAIEEAEEKATDLGITSEIFIRKWAAWLSFSRSNLFTDIRLHDIRIKRDLQAKLQRLQEDAEEEAELQTGEDLVVESTPMFDERPEDPDEICWP